MGGFYILYDIENDIAVRVTKKDGAKKLKTLNPKLKSIMEVSGWQCSASKMDNTKDMTSLEYNKYFKNLEVDKNGS